MARFEATTLSQQTDLALVAWPVGLVTTTRNRVLSKPGQCDNQGDDGYRQQNECRTALAHGEPEKPSGKQEQHHG